MPPPEAISAPPVLPAQVLAALPSPILVCDDAGRLLLANPALCTLLDRDAAELAGARLADVVPPRLHTVDGEPLHGVLGGRAARRDQAPYRMVALRRDRLEIEVEVTAVLLPPQDHLVLTFSVIHDEAEARGRPGSYRQIFEHAPLGILHFDGRGVITECNDNFVAIIGSSRRVLIGLNMQTLPDQDIVRCVRAALAGELGGYEGEYRSATGKKATPVSVLFAPIMEDGVLTGGVGIIRDDSERKAAIDALRQSEASFRALIEGTPDGIAVIHDDRLAYANPTLARALGYGSPAEIRGRAIAELVVAEDLGQLPRGAAPEISARPEVSARPPALVVLRWRRADGRVIETEAAAVDVRFDGAAAVAVVARDVTETKALRARLAQADRLAALGTLAAGVAHEINNPLAYLMASIETAQRLLARPGPAPRLEPLLARALDGAERVRRIVQDLRLFSRPEETRHAAIDLHVVLDAAINICWGEIKHRAQLDKRYGDIPPVRGDEVRLGQVFVNLLVNAAHAMPDDGHGHCIAITTAATDDGRVTIDIADDGVGIPAELVPRVFEPFLTTKPIGVGTGLGLSICHGLVTALGGEIGIDSEIGRGTTVRVTLLAAGPGLAAPPPLESEAAAPSSRILIIDDETQLVQSLQLELGERHDVQVATSSRAALDILLGDDRFDLVLCDVVMNGASGLELYQTVRRTRPELAQRFAFMTGGVLSAEAFEELRSTGRPRLDKPFPVDEVERLLRTAAAGGAP